ADRHCHSFATIERVETQLQVLANSAKVGCCAGLFETNRHWMKFVSEQREHRESASQRHQRKNSAKASSGLQLRSRLSCSYFLLKWESHSRRASGELHRPRYAGGWL